MERPTLPTILFLAGLISLVSCRPASFNGEANTLSIGIGRVNITPNEPIRMSGYGGRTGLSTGVAGQLWAKALAIGEAEDTAILVTLDLVGIPSWLTQNVVKELGIPESNLALCATHTHSGPHLRDVLNPIFMEDIPPDHWAVIDRYSDDLISKVVNACRLALNDRKPGRLSWSQGEVGFAGNRRVLENGIWTGFGTQADGPVDRSLPVMKITDSAGNLRGF